LNPIVYEQDREELLSRGLYLDMRPWGYHVFELTTVHPAARAEAG
jgi:hypothetical protein